MGQWQALDLDGYADLQRQVGETLVATKHVWWRRVRPLFFRPNFPFQVIQKETRSIPWSSRIGAAQFLVSNATTANSALTYLVFQDVTEYSLDRLSKSRRYDVRQAKRHFHLEVADNLDDLVKMGHPCYLEFYRRTGYQFRADRQTIEGFRSWIEPLFHNPACLILCAHSQSRIEAVSISTLVEGHLFYASFFARNEALKRGVSDLALHGHRERAAQEKGICNIVAGKAGMDRGLDQFYLSRGAEKIDFPARTLINPITSLLLRRVSPRIHSELVSRPPEFRTRFSPAQLDRSPNEAIASNSNP